MTISRLSLLTLHCMGTVCLRKKPLFGHRGRKKKRKYVFVLYFVTLSKLCICSLLVSQDSRSGALWMTKAS